MTESDYWNHKFNEEQHQIQIFYSDIGYIAMRPSTIYKPKMYKDGNQWCALYGENIQDGVCGFGTTPEKAMYNFDKSWTGEN